ncbi:spore coat protein [Brevibacillus choshinensis]|uniref:Spore coat protein n=1 Tax=Brevibacillus choshinensis TaxID=54911 RepID=A0ABX7FV82_BRECH|nr:spore coat protein [Brevibacillus choshinensis]QRG69202.1 spore coat protein [Brevibacillus choshinensis]
MQSHPYGAHEVIELHEVLNSAVDVINTAHLYVPYIRDPQLAQMVHHQLQFMQGEYNGLVFTIQGLGAGELLPYRPMRNHSAAMATVAQPQHGHWTEPHYAAQMDDRDVASALLGMHKNGAKLKMAAALEAGHPQIRDLLLQGSVNCAKQAYEVWGYMQQRGYYTWAAMPDETNSELLRGYQPIRSQTESGLGQETTSPMPAPPAASLMKEPVNGARVAPPDPNQNLTPVNAAPVFSPPPYRQDANSIMEDTSLATDALQTQGIDTPDTLSQQQSDGRQTRSRKKNMNSDSLLGQ